jgi:hypothetical protein
VIGGYERRFTKPPTADPLQRLAEAQGLGLRHRQAVDDAQGRIALARRLAIIMHAMLRDGSKFKPA